MHFIEFFWSFLVVAERSMADMRREKMENAAN